MQSPISDDVLNLCSSPASMVSSSGAEACNRPRSSEKSAFSQTCILLSKYLKENGSLGDLRIGVSRVLHGTGAADKSDRVTGMTMDLFPTSNNPVDDSSASRTGIDPPRETTSFHLFSPNKTDNIESGGPRLAGPAQLTIFYAGKVMVFDDVPADKAAEIIRLAGSSSAPQESKPTADCAQLLHPDPPTPIMKREFVPDDTSLNQKPLPVVIHDLPIARKASLQRFLAKRKDRIAGRGPYEVSGMSLACDGGGGESKSWLGMGLI